MNRLRKVVSLMGAGVTVGDGCVAAGDGKRREGDSCLEGKVCFFRRRDWIMSIFFDRIRMRLISTVMKTIRLVKPHSNFCKCVHTHTCEVCAYTHM